MKYVALISFWIEMEACDLCTFQFTSVGLVSRFAEDGQSKLKFSIINGVKSDCARIPKIKIANGEISSHFLGVDLTSIYSLRMQK